MLAAVIAAPLAPLAVECPPGQGALTDAQGGPVCHPCPGLGEVPVRALNLPQGCSTPAPGVLLAPSEYAAAGQVTAAGARCAARLVVRTSELRMWQGQAKACHERGRQGAQNLRAQTPQIEDELRTEDRDHWFWAGVGALLGTLISAWAL